MANPAFLNTIHKESKEYLQRAHYDRQLINYV